MITGPFQVRAIVRVELTSSAAERSFGTEPPQGVARALCVPVAAPLFGLQESHNTSELLKNCISKE